MSEHGHRIGLLGCGRISTNHLRAYRDRAALDDRGSIVALCDADPTALARQADAFDIATRYRSLEDLAADSDIDVVAVLTPPEIRLPVVIPLLEAGKHLLVEKPFSHSRGEAGDMVAAAAANGRLLAVNQNYRWRADTVKLKELIDGGAIGQIVGMHQLFAGWRDEGVGWRASTEYLALAVMAVHWLDRFRWLAGDEAIRIYCASRSSGLLSSRGEDWAAATVTFRNGVIAHLTEDWVSTTRHGHDTFVIDGTSGSLVAEGWVITRYGRDVGDVTRHVVEENFVPTFATSMRELLAAIDEGREPSISGRDNLLTIELLEAAYRSAASGSAVDL